jgi:hypothetical protein
MTIIHRVQARIFVSDGRSPLERPRRRGRGRELERIPIGWNHPIDKNTLKINLFEHVLIGKVSQLFRNML